MCKKAVLIIHGFSGGLWEMEHLFNYLEFNSNYDVYAFTLPGHEKLIIKDVKYQQWIDSSIDMINMLKKRYKKIYLIGHSMGGVISTYLASTNKEVKKLVLLAPAFDYMNLQQNKIDIKNKIKTHKNVIEKKEEAYKDIFGKLFSVPIKTFLEFRKLVKNYHDYPKEVKCKTLIMHGDEDEVIPLSSSLYAYNNINTKHKYYKVIKGVKHRFLISDKKADINKYILSFLKGGLKWKKLKELEF